jgi:predicted transcriptional regulator
MTKTTITVNIDSNVLGKLKKLALAQKQKKGFLGRVISEAVGEYLSEQEQDEIAARQLKKMRKGYDMGRNLIKHRDELHDRKIFPD